MGRQKPKKRRRISLEERRALHVVHAEVEMSRRANMKAAFDEAFGDMTDVEIAEQIVSGNQSGNG